MYILWRCVSPKLGKEIKRSANVVKIVLEALFCKYTCINFIKRPLTGNIEWINSSGTEVFKLKIIRISLDHQELHHVFCELCLLTHLKGVQLPQTLSWFAMYQQNINGCISGSIRGSPPLSVDAEGYASIACLHGKTKILYFAI